MNNKNIWKKGVSLLLVFSLLMGIVGTGSRAFASGTTDHFPAELKDYTRVTMGDFNIEASTETAGTKYTEQKESSYTGATLNKTYLDVDVNFHGGTGGNYFQYLHKSDWGQYVRVIHYGDGLSVFEGANTTNSVWMAEPSNNKFINLKLAVDMAVNASDNTQSDITLKIWVDNVYQGTLQFTAKAEELKNIYIVASESSPISFRTPTEQKVEIPGRPEELKDYTRITMEDFNIEASTETAGTKYTEQKESSYTGATLNKTYLDVDVNFHGGTGGNYFQYLHKSDWGQYVRVIHYGDGLSAFEGANTTNSVWMAEPSNNKFINLKLAVDIAVNASDNTQSDITLKIWVDNVYQGTLQFTAKAEELKNIYIVASESSPISFRTPTEQKVEQPSTPEELKNYTRITMEDFSIDASTESVGTKYTEQKESSYTGETLNKTYLDVDVNFHGGTGGSYFQYLHKSDWSQYLRVIHYGDGLSAFEGANTTNSVWMAEPSNNEFINLKLAVDMSVNASDSTKSDITLKIWVDNVYQGTLQFIAKAEELKNIYIVASESSPISFRTPIVEEPEPGPGQEPGPGTQPEIPTLAEALEGYTRVTLDDFEGLGAAKTKAGTKYTAEATGVYNGTTLNKTYLDVDVNFNGVTDNFFHYLAETNWDNYKRISCSESGLLLWDPLNTEAGSLWTQVSANEYFNLKIRTDIKTNAKDSSKEDVTLQLWVNDTYVGEKTWTEDVQERNLLYVYVAKGSISFRTPSDGEGTDEPKEPNVDEMLKGYTQVTTDDFAIVGGTFKHGWTEGNWMGYEYPESLNHTYLDVDIAFCDDANFHNTIRYLSIDGWQSLQIGIAEGELRVFETSTNTMIYKVPLTEIGIIADTFFNMKLSTDFVTNKSDASKTDITVSLWVNDKLVHATTGKEFSVVKGCTTVGNMLGVYVPNPGTISMKATTKKGEDAGTNATKQPNEDLKKITFGNFAIKDGKYVFANQTLGAEGTYIFSVNGTVFSGDFHFSKELGADFRYGGKGNPWNGLRFWTTGDGKLYMQDATEKTDIYEFHPMYAGVQLVDNTFNMKISVEFVDSDKDGKKDDVKLGVWFNDVLYRDSYIYLIDYASQLGNACSIYVQKKDAWLKIASDKSVDTGVDFTLFGFTKNWKKELGIK